ncbi:hypothetical protein PVAND_006651 [Polypedilum vanderplanki]|uniref:Glutaredoxin-2, mitochondrial n=1 Tax=Polypedilum vanderplanki TaxID=319348 RepID=A0A9J6C3V1_POLVA|nr:hypothetical protein PVAND_006651 [Polypedilum vanderplanki]
MAEKFVKDTISKERVVIFSKTYCPYCEMAKQPFKKMNVKFLAIELEDRDDCSEIQDVLNDLTGARTVPRVFIDGKFVGGGTDIKKLYESGELANMLSK